MAENQATIIPAQPDYELLVCWFLPDGKINVTRTPILAWRVDRGAYSARTVAFGGLSFPHARWRSSLTGVKAA